MSVSCPTTAQLSVAIRRATPAGDQLRGFTVILVICLRIATCRRRTPAVRSTTSSDCHLRRCGLQLLDLDTSWAAPTWLSPAKRAASRPERAMHGAQGAPAAPTSPAGVSAPARAARPASASTSGERRALATALACSPAARMHLRSAHQVHGTSQVHDAANTCCMLDMPNILMGAVVRRTWQISPV